MRVLTVVGARPQFVKAAVVSKKLREAGVDEVMIHTGQHYAAELSDVFFHELELAPPACNLGIGSGGHGVQTGRMMGALEEYISGVTAPDWVLVYGDTNTTLAAALVAAKLCIRLAHVEAGLRSYSRTMPEEVNRVVTDHLSDALFCPTETAVRNLSREGVVRGVHLVGDVMYDATRAFEQRAAEEVPLGRVVPFGRGEYALATVHRAENTDNMGNLQAILEGFRGIPMPVVLPAHPRLARLIDERTLPDNVLLLAPQSYLSMLTLVRSAGVVLTDSGGLQKEALWLGTPCVTLREETEWVETLRGGWNQLAGADPERIVEAASRVPEGRPPVTDREGASGRIVSTLLEYC
jgi:UDP-GlcNAc3NAcA epimerase